MYAFALKCHHSYTKYPYIILNGISAKISAISAIKNKTSSVLSFVVCLYIVCVTTQQLPEIK